MRELIVNLLKKGTGLKKQTIEKLVEAPPSPELGDYAFPCFILVEKLKKNPSDICVEIAREIKPRKEISEVKAVGPYLNFFINKKLLAEKTIKEILKKTEKYGAEKEKKKIIIDFSSPNIGKPMHIGHIRSTILGDSLKKTFEFLGNKVIGINYLGDIGLHVGKLIMAYKLWGNEEKIQKNPEKELLSLYVKFCKKEKLSLEKTLEKSLEQEERERYLDNKWSRKARKALEKLEENDREYKKIWNKIKKYSLKEFLKTYKRLGIEFDEITGQSEFSDIGKKIVKEALKKGVAIKGKNGEIVVKLERDGLADKVILRSDGSVIYSTQDLGAAVKRYKKYKFDKMIYVVGIEQELYFLQIFKILEKLGYKWTNKLIYLPFGLLRLKQGKISSREGRVLFLQDIIEKAKILALEQIKVKSPKLKNKQRIAEKIAIGVLKYSILSKEPIKNIEFRFSEAISFEGNTGPYLQYSYARASSILRKANKKPTTSFKVPELTKQENEFIKKLAEFPEVVKKSTEQLNPALLASYSFELAQIFNEFYQFCFVINSESEEFRIALTQAFRVIIKKSLYLLGIETMEKM